MTRVNKAYLFFMIYTVIYFGSVYILSFFPSLYSLDLMVYNTIGQIVMFLPILLVGLVISKEPPKNVLMLNKISITDIILSIFLALAIEPAMTLLSILSTLIFPNEVSEYLALGMDSPLIISIISVAVIPAIFEELVFRGILFSHFKNVSLKKACIIAGLLFGIAHFNAQQLLYAFAMGALSCLVVYKTKSIYPTIIVHFTINFSQLMLSRIDLENMALESANTVGEAAMAADVTMTELIAPYLFLTIVSIPIIFLILLLMGRKYGRFTRKTNIPQPALVDMSFIEDESIFDYAPEKEFEEKVFTIPFLVIIIGYIILVAATYLLTGYLY